MIFPDRHLDTSERLGKMIKMALGKLGRDAAEKVICAECVISVGALRTEKPKYQIVQWLDRAGLGHTADRSRAANVSRSAA
jgi:hypothetical protein